MRPRLALISLLAGALAACGTSTSTSPRLSYAPPEGEVAKPSPAGAAQPSGLIWNQLLDRLIQSPLEVAMADPDRGIVVARYSGDPTPYVTCGYILVERGGKVEQVPASSDARVERMVQGRRLALNRDMKLDARLVVQVKPEGAGAAVETTSNYVLTKTVVAENPAGWTRGSAREVVSFSSGGRGAFSKGTVCQPKGELERTVLDVLPQRTVAMKARDDVPAAAGTPATDFLPGDRSVRVESVAPPPALAMLDSTSPPDESGTPAPETEIAEEVGPAPDAAMAELMEDDASAADVQEAEDAPPTADEEMGAQEPSVQTATPAPSPEAAEDASASEDVVAAPAPAPPPAEPDEVAAEPATAPSESTEAAAPAAPEQTARATPYECPSDDAIFCEVLDLTDPYRRANLERDLGLALDALEPDNPLLEGSALGIDISLPKYPSYLTVSYFLDDGRVRHALSGSDRRWPANAREFVPGVGLGDRESIEMVVVLASDVPVFPSPRPPAEDAEQYLRDLRARLAELRNGTPAQIAASLIVITPA